MDAVNAEQLPAPVKKEKRHIEATLYAPGPAKYASSSQSSCIHEIVGSHSMHTSSDGIIANNEEQYTQDDSPSGGFGIYHHSSWYTGGIHAQIPKSTLQRGSALPIHGFLS